MIKLREDKPIAILGIKEVLELMPQYNIPSVRNFRAVGTNCNHCDIKGTHFSVYLNKSGFEIQLWGTNIKGRRDRLTIDHIIPLSQGGADNSTNMQCLCTKCHNKKTQSQENVVKWHAERLNQEPYLVAIP